MAIIYNEDKKVFNIKSKNTSYALMVADTGHLIHLYWGRKLESNKLDYIFKKYGKGSFLADTDNIDNFSIELNTVEYPTYGHTDLRSILKLSILSVSARKLPLPYFLKI